MMSWGQFLFSFNGRINRAKYWLYVVGAFATITVIALFLIGITVLSPMLMMVPSAVAAVIYLALLYAGLAVGAKRLHDRNKSAWWLLAFYLAPALLSGVAGVPDSLGLKLIVGFASMALGIWGFVELGYMSGTVGPNEYGPDPLPEMGRRTR
jgi:uncharacterized membrane protein YhaH (DUF805 family)